MMESEFVVKKICFVTSAFEPGVRSKSFFKLVNYFFDRGYEVSVINLCKSGPPAEINPGIRIVLPGHDLLCERKRFDSGIKLIPFVRKQIKKINPELILCFGDWYNPFILLSAAILKIPVYVFDHSPIWDNKFFPRISRKIIYRYGATNIIVPTAKASKYLAREMGLKNVSIIPIPVAPIETDTSQRKTQIVSVGSFLVEKGHELLLRAFSRMEEKGWSLHLIGEGPEKERLSDLADVLKISDKVHFYGNPGDANRILGESEIFVLPSFRENFPCQLVEAMSVPLACISSNCVSGPSEIIRHGKNGLLFSVKNENELLYYLNRLTENKELIRQIQDQASLAHSFYSVEKVGAAIENLYL